MERSCTQINWESMALITIDMQNDFIRPEGAMPVDGAAEVIPAVSVILKAARKAAVPIIHMVRYYLADGSNADICRRDLIASGVVPAAPETAGAEIADELKPEGFIGKRMNALQLMNGHPQKIADREWMIYKPRWGAFYQTPLEALLDEEKIDSLIFMGINFPNCPRTSVYEASERDYRLGLVTDGMSRLYDKDAAELKNIGVSMFTGDALIAKMENIRERSKESPVR